MRRDFRSSAEDAYLGKESVDEPVKNTTEDFIPHQDSEQQIAQNHSTRELNRIWPMPRSCEADTDGVESENKSEEFTADDMSTTRDPDGFGRTDRY